MRVLQQSFFTSGRKVKPTETNSGPPTPPNHPFSFYQNPKITHGTAPLGTGGGFRLRHRRLRATAPLPGPKRGARHRSPEGRSLPGGRCPAAIFCHPPSEKAAAGGGPAALRVLIGEPRGQAPVPAAARSRRARHGGRLEEMEGKRRGAAAALLSPSPLLLFASVGLGASRALAARCQGVGASCTAPEGPGAPPGVRGEGQSGCPPAASLPRASPR